MFRRHPSHVDRSYHKLPPVFHETAKFWACCPDKKCYDWDSFMGVKVSSLALHCGVEK